MSGQSYRQPCPGRIFEDLGVGFSIGCFGGSIFYFLKGKQNIFSENYDKYRCMAFTTKKENYGRIHTCKK